MGVFGDKGDRGDKGDKGDKGVGFGEHGCNWEDLGEGEGENEGACWDFRNWDFS